MSDSIGNSSNSKKQIVECRVIMVDYVSKMIMMSGLETMVNLEQDKMQNRRGEVLDGFKVVRQISSGYLVESEGVRILMRKKWMDDQTHNDIILADKKTMVDKKVKLVEYDYLGRMWLGMGRQADMEKIESVVDLQAG